MDYPTLTYSITEVERGIYGYGGVLCRASSDGCMTAQGVFGSDTDAFMLPWVTVASMMEQMPGRMDLGQVSRGNELGHFRVNTYTYPEFELSWGPERHNKVRPYMNSLWGPDAVTWSRAGIRESVRTFLAGIGDSFNVAEGGDLSKWVETYLHKVSFDLVLTEEELEEFLGYQQQSLAMVILPDFLNPFLRIAPPVDEYFAKREKWREFYLEKIPWDTHSVLKDVPESLRMDVVKSTSAAAIFAGGLGVPHAMQSVMALIYADESPANRFRDLSSLSDEQLEAFIWETLRLYYPVAEFPWIENEIGRRYLMIQMKALRDPTIFGDDVDDFVLRDMQLYHNYSGIGFAEPANGVEKNGNRWVQKANSRGCPGQDLAFWMIFEFVKEWAKWQDQWVVAADSPTASADFFFTDADLWSPPVTTNFKLARK